MEDNLLGRIDDLNVSAREDRYRTFRDIDNIFESLIFIVRELKKLDKRLTALENQKHPGQTAAGLPS